MDSDSDARDRARSAQYLWCRLDVEVDVVRRVQLMHPNGEIWLSYPPEHFEANLLLRMRAGQLHAYLEPPAGDGTRRMRIEDDSSRVLFSELVPADRIAPGIGQERAWPDSDR